jgi:hypothetical protein
VLKYISSASKGETVETAGPEETTPTGICYFIKMIPLIIID